MNIWSNILSKAKNVKKNILIVVIDTKGSIPGKKGFKMLVSEDGSLSGSVGGGVVEQKAVEFAREMIRRNEKGVILKSEDHNIRDLNEISGYKKSGSQTIAWIPLTSGIIKEIELLEKSQANDETGILMFSNSGIKFEKNRHQDKKYFCNIESDRKWEFSEMIGSSDKLYIFGAGHVSLALCQICSLLDFKIQLFDNRTGLSTFIANTFANTKEIIEYNNIKPLIKGGKRSYAIIMSHTHEEDEILLGQLVEKDLKYLGMLGSNRKVAKLKANLVSKGNQEKQFENLHAPIGIDINSQSPMEIAVSIAAELIQVKNS